MEEPLSEKMFALTMSETLCLFWGPFDEDAQGMSDRLNEAGVPTRIPGDQWTADMVARIEEILNAASEGEYNALKEMHRRSN